MPETADIVIRRASQIFTAAGDPAEPEVLADAAVAVRGGDIVWVGPEREADELAGPGTETIDASGCVVTPGLVDPHTHVVFAGSRPLEFEWRLQGRPYLEILESGGGILSTVRSVREASAERLVAESLPRLRRMLEFGITTCEVKSGYGLDPETETKMLRAIRDLSDAQPVRLVPTFLGAHTFPPEFRDDREAYVRLLVDEMIPGVAGEGLATACDVYVERSAFDPEQARRILEAARRAGLALHVHAGQFNDLAGPELAASLGALSVDHLDVISDAGLEAMARAGTVAVLLPGACISLGAMPPRIDRFREAGVPVALATDCNPGTSYSENLPLMAFLGATMMGFGCGEALMAVTGLASRALGRLPPDGTIAAGGAADLVVHDVGDWREILYHFGVSHVACAIVGGRVAYRAT